MKSIDYRMVDISENIQIPVPINCNLEEEQAAVAKFLANNDLAELEREYEELATAIRERDLVSADELLSILELEAAKNTAPEEKLNGL